MRAGQVTQETKHAQDDPSAWWAQFLVVERGPIQRHAVAAALAAGSLGIVYVLSKLETANFSSLTLASVVLSAIYGGRGPAMLCALVTAVGIDYLLAEPLFQVFDSWTSLLRIVTYGTVGCLIADLVSSLRAAYRRLHEAHQKACLAVKARDNVLAMVSHDLRSPLSSVLLHAGFLWRALAQAEPVTDLRSGLESIHRSARTMNRLIEDLLDAVKIEAGRFRVEQKMSDLLPVIEDAIESTRSAAEAKRIRLVLDVPNARQELSCDRDRLTQAMTNLLSNAVKFSPDGAPVEVKLDSSGDWISISVQDWGPGIPDEHLCQLFRPYWQAAETAHLGTGLGLYISKSIVDAHGGRIEVRSAQTRGAVFTVLLPKPAACAA
jgi:signal transduction histidine kinase